MASPGQPLLLEAGYGQQISNIDNRRQHIDLDQPVGYDISSAVDQSGRVFRARTSYGDSPSYVYMARASAAYITGSHSFKTGMNLVRGANLTRTGVNNAIGVRLVNDRPSQITLSTAPTETNAIVNADIGLYAQDQWIINRLSLNFGVRFDYLNSDRGRWRGPAGAAASCPRATSIG